MRQGPRIIRGAILGIFVGAVVLIILIAADVQPALAAGVSSVVAVLGYLGGR